MMTLSKSPAEGTAMGAAHGVKQRRLPPGVSHPVDIHVGSRVRLRRTLLGMTQEHLANAVGLTFQQVQKYERGANRISASRLFEFSEILDVPVSFFFDDLPDRFKTRQAAVAWGLSDHAQPALEPDPVARRESLELMRAYYRISHPRVRNTVFELVKALAREATQD